MSIYLTILPSEKAEHADEPGSYILIIISPSPESQSRWESLGPVFQHGGSSGRTFIGHCGRGIDHLVLQPRRLVDDCKTVHANESYE